MTISKNRVDDCLTIALDGRLDTITSPELEAVVKDSIGSVKKLVFDFDKLEYNLLCRPACDPFRTEDHEQAGRDADYQRL